MAVIIWQVGFARHPHDVVVACVVAVIVAVPVV